MKPGGVKQHVGFSELSIVYIDRRADSDVLLTRQHNILHSAVLCAFAARRRNAAVALLQQVSTTQSAGAHSTACHFESISQEPQASPLSALRALPRERPLPAARALTGKRPEALNATYYIAGLTHGAVLIPLLLWYGRGYLLRRYALFGWLQQQGEALLQRLSTRDRTLLWLSLLAIFIGMEIFWRMMFEVIIGYFQMHQYLQTLVLRY